MTESVGIIGVGHLGAYMVQGFYGVASDITIVLSPRGKKQAARLAQTYGCKVARDNQQVVDQCEIIILSVKPKDVVAVLEDVTFRPDQIVISVAAGVRHEVVSQGAHPATAVCALPISSAAVNQSPTLLYPAEERARQVMDLLGPVIMLPDEAQFITASTFSAFYGWHFKFLEDLIGWSEGKGLSPEISRTLVQQVFRSTADMSAVDPERSLEDIVASLATPGGITRQGQDILDQADAFDVWGHALDAVHERLKKNT